VEIRIGTCGWSCDHWQPELYAPGQLARYAPPSPPPSSTAASTADPGHRRSATGGRNLPDGFRLSAKALRGLTHRRKLDAP
jgi:uncharacterized protein YecE (DUF72 family)